MSQDLTRNENSENNDTQYFRSKSEKSQWYFLFSCLIVLSEIRNVKTMLFFIPRIIFKLLLNFCSVDFKILKFTTAQRRTICKNYWQNKLPSLNIQVSSNLIMKNCKCVVKHTRLLAGMFSINSLIIDPLVGGRGENMNPGWQVAANFFDQYYYFLGSSM